MQSKYKKLQTILAQHASVAVAYSGGVDSTFLLHTACAVLGPGKVTALHAKSPLLARQEAGRVSVVIETLGCQAAYFQVDPFIWPQFVANPPNRCYLCKKRIYQTILRSRILSGGAVLLDGTNHDDLQESRPGHAAIAELRVQTPLAAAGLTKKEIRRLSREHGLSTWNSYSASCFATRIAHGEPITPGKILFVASCESFLATLGFNGVRVRLSGQVATLEVVRDDLDRVQEKDVISMISNEFMRLGAGRVQVNPCGRPPLDL
ncbi:ATP-dependent sacrificial sulfur transferase LarE [Thiovibrio sp. JS02]